MDEATRGESLEKKRPGDCRNSAAQCGARWTALAAVARATFFLAAFSPGVLEAQSLLRWKLKAGDSLAIETKQQTESQVAFSGKGATTKIDIDVGLEWQVAAADDKEITLKQTIVRAVVKLGTPRSGGVEFDSTSQARPTGPGRELAEAIKPLIGATFEMRMDTRGSILEVKPANAAAETFSANTEKMGGAGGGSRGVVQQLLRRPLVVLPEKEVQQGDEWTSSVELETPIGKFRQETTYRLAGTEKRDGQPVERIVSTAKLVELPAERSAGAKGGETKVKPGEQTGSVLFSAEAGRVVESSQHKQIVTERSYRDTTIVVTMSSEQKTTVSAKE